MNGKVKNKFGTFAGVYTPSILTILGIIMFMNAGTVVGYAGLFGGLAILVLCKAITTLTSLSISAISTNTKVKGGGSYYLITRSIGAEPGGAIGVTLYLALALSVPFYIIGLVDALKAFDALRPFITENYLAVCLCFAGFFFFVTYVGAGIALKVQFLILIILGTSILTFMTGLVIHFDGARFAANIMPASAGLSGSMSFWVLFAIYFPAVTGITAGVSMSGDLKEPAKSIPIGTLAAVGTGFLIYVLQMVLMAGGLERVAAEGVPSLVHNPYLALKMVSGKFGILVAMGAIAATASSTIGSFVSAPRILQALSRDHLYKILSPFGKGALRGDEPRRALWLTLVITVITLVTAAKLSENALNAVAVILTMFFLASYGTVNISAFVEAFGGNPSFRPRFKLFHWSTALAGAAGCFAAAVLISWIAALAAAAIIAGLYFYLVKKKMEATFGDARRGFTFTKARNAILQLRNMPDDAKNWRPNIIVLCGNPDIRHTLVRYASWMEADRGLLTLVNFIVGEISEKSVQRERLEKELAEFIDKHNMPALAEVNVTSDFDKALSIFLQSHSLRPLRANVLMLGWTRHKDRAEALVARINVAYKIGMSLLLLHDRGLPDFNRSLRLDVWWRGLHNGSLMLILAHLITLTERWKHAKIRLLRLVGTEVEKDPAEEELRGLAEYGRMNAECKAVVSDRPFLDILHEESFDASVVFLGFRLPEVKDSDEFHSTYEKLIKGMPTTIVACSSGEANLFA